MNSLSQVDNSAEQAVLGSILLNQDVLDAVGFLEPDDFTGDTHQTLYKAMKYLDEENKSVDFVTVAQLYADWGRATTEGVSYLQQLANSVPTTANAKFYASIVRSKAHRRRGLAIAEQINKLTAEDFDNDEDYFAAIEDAVEQVRPAEVGRMESLKDFEDDYFKHLTTKVSRIETGFAQFDEWSKGLGRTDLFVSAGRPSMGKTAMLLQRIRGILENQSSGSVLLWSQEMSKFQVIDRMLSSLTEIKFPKINQKILDDFEIDIMRAGYEKYMQKPLYVQDSAGVTIQEIRSTARQFKRRYGKIDLIAVDYLQIMSIPEKPNETRAAAIGRVTATAKKIAKDMDCPFMLLSQMTRESEQKKKPTLADLKESSAIEADADVVEFLWHDPNDKIRGGKVVQQLIAKGRNIGINDFRLHFRGYIQQFKELRNDEAN